jgi:phosphoribosyl 1,2-cyclic phosphodiesterase
MSFMSFKVCVLGSGSSGNCTVLWTETEALLIDCGRLSYRYIKEQLAEVGIPPEMIKGILVTHAHTDHISRTAVRLAKEHSIPIYLHKRIYHNILSSDGDSGIETLHDRQLVRYHPDSRFFVGEFLIFPFNTHHRAGCVTMSLGFCVVYKGRKIGYVTDCGCIDENIIAAMSGSHVAVIEANHDVELVRNGTRHYLAKKWVLSDEGHLSNEAAAELIRNLSAGDNPLRHVLLAHISEDHNVLDEVAAHIAGLVDNDSVKLSVTYHHSRSEIIEIDKGKE